MKKKNIQVVEKLSATDFPPCVRTFWTNAKSPGDPMIGLKFVIIALVCYAVLMPRLRVKYLYNLMLSIVLLNLLVIGPSGKGKSIVNYIVNYILKVLFERDMKERDLEYNFKRENKRKAANQRRDEEPLWAYRMLQKFTLPVAVKLDDNIRRRYGDSLPFFLFANELGSFIENKRGNVEFQAVARTAYNAGELYTRDTLYEGGYNGSVDIVWNSIMCGQETALEGYITKAGLLMGDASRHIIIKIGEAIGEEMPTLKPFTPEQQLAINDAVTLLMNETFTADDKLAPVHEIDMSFLNKDVENWCNYQREIIAKTLSRAHDSFYGRASETAFRLATVLFHLWREDTAKRRNVRKCYYYLADYILKGLMTQWGKKYEAAMPREGEVTLQRPTLYDSITKRFTRKQLADEILKQGITSPCRKFIYLWKQKNWIYEVEGEPDTYEKIY